ncbi:MAG: hypothetical protein Q8M86_03975 [Syntrophales bacterium]|nr:hypothetical protein [Syntrophales bacterium]
MSTHIQFNEDLFRLVVSHLEAEAHSLHAIRRFVGGGIEGWFKVEVVSALADMVQTVCNKGPDLLLSDGTEVELKAGCGLDAARIRNGALAHGVPCLFLGYGGNLTLLNTADVELVQSAELSDGHDNWVVGLIRPRR